MSAQTLSELQARIAHCDQVVLDALAPGFVQLIIQNARASARIALYGAQVLSFQPQGERDLLWLSADAHYAKGRSIRGGIPLCWPWFGPHPDEPDKPAHGFARHGIWQLEQVRGDEQATELEFSLPPSPETQSLWPHAAKLVLRVLIAESLRIELITTNTDNSPIEISAALHSYFAVSDISAIHIDGLDDTLFRDALNDDRICKQCGPVRFNAELDRVYHDTDADLIICDPALKRRIRITKGGSRSTVVWNPWIAKSARLGDIPEGGYRQMVCVETANVDHNRLALLPGESHSLYSDISTEADD